MPIERLLKYEDAPYYKPKATPVPMWSSTKTKITAEVPYLQRVCHNTRPHDPFPTDSVKEAVKMGLDGLVFLKTLGARIHEVLDGLDDPDVDVHCPHAGDRIRGSTGPTNLYFCDGCWDAYRFHLAHGERWEQKVLMAITDAKAIP